jgi:hypothetical protein
MNRHSLGFWLWPAGAAMGSAVCIGLDIFLIASAVVPAVPGLFLIFAFPAGAGLLVGFGNRRADIMDLFLMAMLSAAALYVFMVALSIVGLAMSSNVSCSEPQAPVNCDNDIGAGVGLFVGLLIAAIFSAVMWFGSMAGVAIRSRSQPRVSSSGVGASTGDSS